MTWGGIYRLASLSLLSLSVYCGNSCFVPYGRGGRCIIRDMVATLYWIYRGNYTDAPRKANHRPRYRRPSRELVQGTHPCMPTRVSGGLHRTSLRYLEACVLFYLAVAPRKPAYPSGFHRDIFGAISSSNSLTIFRFCFLT